MRIEIDVLKKLLLIRLVEDEIAKVYREQEMRCPVHLSLGQEAVAAGIGVHLNKEDKIFTGHRSHAHYLAKGGDLNKFFAEIYGKKTGCSKGRGGSMHLTDLSAGFIGSTPIVAGSIPLAVGVAFAKKYNGEKGIAVAFLGDGATEEGVFHESINFAKLKNLPVLFVVENNKYSVYTSIRDRQPDRSIASIAKAHGLATYVVPEGNNALEVAKNAGEAINKIKMGLGPALIEIHTYRTVEHCGPNNDDELNYRPKEEVRLWTRRDPINEHIKYLLKKRITSRQQISQLKRNIESSIIRAINFAKKSPFPSKKDLGEFIYA